MATGNNYIPGTGSFGREELMKNIVIYSKNNDFYYFKATIFFSRQLILPNLAAMACEAIQYTFLSLFLEKIN